MHRKQAYRVVLLGAFCALSAAARAEDAVPNQIMLAPGKSITFVDLSNLGTQVVVTAPGDAYLNLGKLISVSEKSGIYAVLPNIHVNEASSVSANSDGSLSLRSSTADSAVVRKDVQPEPGRVTLEGGTAAFDRGRVTIYNAVVAAGGSPAQVFGPTRATATLPLLQSGMPSVLVPVSAGAAAAKAPTVVALPAGGLPTGLPVNIQTVTPTSFQAFNIGAGATVNISPSNSAVMNVVTTGGIGIGGQLTVTGAPVVPNPSVPVTGNTGIITFAVGSVPVGANISTGGSLPTGAVVVPASAKPPTVPPPVIK